MNMRVRLGDAFGGVADGLDQLRWLDGLGVAAEFQNPALDFVEVAHAQLNESLLGDKEVNGWRECVFYSSGMSKYSFAAAACSKIFSFG